jgi:tetratricopeptide (TPR) repeat protein
VKSRHRRALRPPFPKPHPKTAAGGVAPAAEAWHRRALAAYAAKDYAAAGSYLGKAVALAPRVASWHTQLGVALRAEGRLAEAIAAHRRAIALDSGLAAAHNNLGNALRAAGEHENAEKALRAALQLDPNYTDAWVNLAQLLHQRGRLAEAEAACRRALELSPGHIGAQRALGHLAHHRADFAAAAAWFSAVCAALPSDAEAFMGLGSAFEGEGRFEEADRAYDRATTLAPDHPAAHCTRARRSEQEGDAAAAALHYRRALERDPCWAGAWIGLAYLPQTRFDAAEKEAIGRLLASPDLPDDGRSKLYYALAWTAEREAAWDAAFRWARLANDFDRPRTAFDEAENLAFVRRTIAAFPAAPAGAGIAAALPTGSLSERPIFILGMPRSGTTLVEQIVTNHPQAAAGGELIDIPKFADEIASTDRPYPECVLDLDAAQARRLAERYLERLQRISATALRVTDKLPFNFRHLGLITALFPQARILHCRRDPRDIAISCYFIRFHRPISFACDLFELGAYLRHYEILMAHWRRVLPRMLDIRYEDLVTDPEREVRRIIDFCGLPWDERVLRFYETERAVRTASVNQVRQPIYASAIGRWRHYARYLTPLLAELEGRPGLAPPPRPPDQNDTGVARLG